MSLPAVVIQHETETVIDDDGPRPRPLRSAQPAAADTVETITVVTEPRLTWSERLARITPAGAAEFILIALLALQCARLVWTLVTPLGPVGAWSITVPAPPPSAPAAATPLDFDPFFRTAPASSAPVVVTSLPLTLHGVREDRATGRGSAIIAAAGGAQNSIGVGEEIMPGVTLTGVGPDSVTISRGGVSEQIFLGAAPAGEAPPEGNAAQAPPAPLQGAPR